jgi:hypothetical protein
MNINHGQKAKVIGYEEKGSHDFKVGEIVTFVCLSDVCSEDEDWYTFEDENNHTQDLIPLEFELI